MENMFAPGLGIDGGNQLNDIGGGPFLFTDVEEFRKAVNAGDGVYQSDVAQLSGGSALRLQSLESTLLTTVQSNEHFVGWNTFSRSDATATVDEFTVKNHIGGAPGVGVFNSELGDINEEAGDYARYIGKVKYLMTKREISVVQKSQRTLIDTEADQKVDATLELLTSSEWSLWNGDEDCLSVEVDGIYAQMQRELTSPPGGHSTRLTADHIYDMRGQSVSPVAAELIESARFIFEFGNFGKIDTMFHSTLVQSDLDQKLDPAFRVAVPGVESMKLGVPVTGVRSTWGSINCKPNIFIREGEAPFAARGAAFANKSSTSLCADPTLGAPSASADATSKFVAATAGAYYYGVEAGNKRGRSTCVLSSAVTVAAGEKVTMAITHATTGDTAASYFCVYRSKRNASSAVAAEMREMKRIKKTGSPMNFVDKDEDIPGTSKIFLLTTDPGRKAIGIRRLLPMTKFPLYPTAKAALPWAQLLFFYLRMGKINNHRILKNVLPSGAAWRPY